MDQGQVSLEGFRELLTTERMRVFQIIPSALVMGATMFALVVVMLVSQKSGQVQEGSGMDMTLLTGVHVGMAFMAYMAAWFMGRFLVSRKRLKMDSLAYGEGPTYEKKEDAIVGAMFTGMVVRMALLEGPAFFGIIICMLGGMNGAESWFWVNLFSYVVMVLVFVMTFPTRDRLEMIFVERFIQGME